MKEKLWAGAAREVITPNIGARLFGYRDDIFCDSINDDLSAAALCFCYGEKRFMLVVCEVCVVATPLADELRAQIAELTGISVPNIFISATHTHSGPCTMTMTGWGGVDGEYCEKIFKPAVLRCAEKAMKAVRPVKMGIGRTESRVGINRRELDEKNGMRLGQNEWGCYDGLMSVLSFCTEDNKPYFNMVHYGTHGTAAGENTEVTRDWAGVMNDCMERETGALTVFIQGAEGDVGPRLMNGETTGDLSYVHELGAVAAADAMRAYRNIDRYFTPWLDAVYGEVKIPVAERMSTKKAEEKLRKLENKETGNMKERHAGYYNQIIAQNRENVPQIRELTMPQSIVSIGGVLLVPSTYELFSEISLRIKKYAGTNRILMMSCTNGSTGYFPTHEQLVRGGYEIESFETQYIQPLVNDADNYYVHEILNLVKEILKREEDNYE